MDVPPTATGSVREIGSEIRTPVLAALEGCAQSATEPGAKTIPPRACVISSSSPPRPACVFSVETPSFLQWRVCLSSLQRQSRSPFSSQRVADIQCRKLVFWVEFSASRAVRVCAECVQSLCLLWAVSLAPTHSVGGAVPHSRGARAGHVRQSRLLVLGKNRVITEELRRK